MKKKILALSLAGVLLLTALSGCTDSSKDSVLKETNYDPAAEIKQYELGELTEEDKSYQVQMGYRDCDHMVASIIGEKAGIYKALGLNVTVTKTGKIMEAMSSGQMDVGYQGIEGAIKSVNNGAPLYMAAANHIGGSSYLVVSNDIKDPKDLIGKNLAIGSGAWKNPSWINYCQELGIPKELENYTVLDMSNKDAMFAMKSGQLQAFSTWDPYAAQAESEGFGRIIGTNWGAKITEDLASGWGMCCIYCINADFQQAHPELAERLILAHALSIKYLYQHPYNAAMMFADGFGVAPEVALRTVYMKTIAEGRTIVWQFGKENLDNYINHYKEMNIPEEEIPSINDYEKFMSTDLLKKSGVEDFNEFIKKEVEPIFPIGITYEEWLQKAKTIDGITE